MFDYLDKLESTTDVLNKDMFFVMGMQKSGTTWLMNLLDGHPEICCWGEGHFPNVLWPALKNGLAHYNGRVTRWHEKFEEIGLAQMPPRFTQNDLHLLYATAILASFSKTKGFGSAKCVGEKTPDNLFGCNRLASLFPKAKFIHIIRDGRDGVLSAWKMYDAMKSVSHRKKWKSFPEYVEYYASTWSKSVRIGRQFHEHFPERYAQVRYEDLHSEAHGQLSRLLEFLAVDTSAEAIALCQKAGAFKAKSGGRRPGEEDPRSFFRKGVVGDWKNGLGADAQACFLSKAGKTLVSLGYTV